MPLPTVIDAPMQMVVSTTPSRRPEGVAPDVAWVDRVFEYLLDRVERPAVQATGAEDRGLI